MNTPNKDFDQNSSSRRSNQSGVGEGGKKSKKSKNVTHNNNEMRNTQPAHQEEEVDRRGTAQRPTQKPLQQPQQRQGMDNQQFEVYQYEQHSQRLEKQPNQSERESQKKERQKQESENRRYQSQRQPQVHHQFPDYIPEPIQKRRYVTEVNKSKANNDNRSKTIIEKKIEFHQITQYNQTPFEEASEHQYVKKIPQEQVRRLTGQYLQNEKKENQKYEFMKELEELRAKEREQNEGGFTFIHFFCVILVFAVAALAVLNYQAGKREQRKDEEIIRLNNELAGLKIRFIEKPTQQILPGSIISSTIEFPQRHKYLYQDTFLSRKQSSDFQILLRNLNLEKNFEVSFCRSDPQLFILDINKIIEEANEFVLVFLTDENNERRVFGVYGNDAQRNNSFIFSVNNKFISKIGKPHMLCELDRHGHKGPSIGQLDIVLFGTNGKSYSYFCNAFQCPAGVDYGSNRAKSYLAGHQEFKIDNMMILTKKK